MADDAVFGGLPNLVNLTNDPDLEQRTTASNISSPAAPAVQPIAPVVSFVAAMSAGLGPSVVIEPAPSVDTPPISCAVVPSAPAEQLPPALRGVVSHLEALYSAEYVPRKMCRSPPDNAAGIAVPSTTYPASWRYDLNTADVIAVFWEDQTGRTSKTYIPPGTESSRNFRRDRLRATTKRVPSAESLLRACQLQSVDEPATYI